MDRKIRVLLHTRWFPFTLAHYFKFALEARSDVELKTVGTFTGANQPYNGGMTMPLKYVKPPTVLIPESNLRYVDYYYAKAYLGDWKPDLVISSSNAPHWLTKPDTLSVTIATDPHVLNDYYDEDRRVSDYFFNMQEVYMKRGDIYLPYAYDPKYHCETGVKEKEYDVAMIGLKYPERDAIVSRLRKMGVRVLYETGLVLDEYREVNNKAWIGINQSSKDDLNARAFEIPQFGQVEIMNPVPDMFKPQHHYFSRAMVFSKIEEAVEHVMWCMDNKEVALHEAQTMKKEMESETYESRIQYLLEKVGLL